MVFGDFVGLKLPDICLISEEKPRKPHPVFKSENTFNIEKL